MIKIIAIKDFHVNRLDVINAVWRLNALMRLFDNSLTCVKQFINHVTEETEMYHRAVVLILVINTLITAHSN